MQYIGDFQDCGDNWWMNKYALSTRWRSNISTIEISGTEQSPGGVPIYPVKDPILS